MKLMPHKSHTILKPEFGWMMNVSLTLLAKAEGNVRPDSLVRLHRIVCDLLLLFIGLAIFEGCDRPLFMPAPCVRAKTDIFLARFFVA
jgi:hypothetical protein